ncbi:putative ubiquitin carboxyl-terminal hydrolase FAF-Y [Rhizoctonia solani]|uniref:Putative ubiquitin carboxyl-terminal hydrolase FAF-Y n=1 Tax=Rhizoctonia solani TaxID=456999 RepID=A0A0K6GGT2_9AGAM|nr:putative ubiquitin carboxyl-terminal hydrolase FAF-Y [Rhizoctonia solani]
MIRNAQQNHRAKRARQFGISAVRQGVETDSESEGSSSYSTSAPQAGNLPTGTMSPPLGSDKEPRGPGSIQDVGEIAPSPPPRRRRVKKPIVSVPHLSPAALDVLPQAPVVEEPCILQLHEDRTGTFETLPDAFGVFRRYHSRPYTIPDQACELEHYSNREYENGNKIEALEKDVKAVIWPCPNISTFLVQHWHWVEGGHKTRSSRDSLVNKVLLDPQFKLEHIRLSAGWNAVTLRLKVPSYQSGTASSVVEFPIPNFQYRTLVGIMIEAFSHNDPTNFHYEPFELHCLVSTLSTQSQRLYGEIYNSKAMLDLHDEIQLLPPEPGCDLPRVVAAFMFSSDGAQVAQFSTTNIHPVYCYFGNQSKYERCKPSSNACFDLAHIPPLPDAVETFLDKLSKNGKTIKNMAMLAHLRRELMHEVWGKLLDDQFVDAWVHGCVIECADGIKRRVYPRILTYSADYPERVLLTTIRNMGKCACPRCLMPKFKFKFVGQQNDIKFRTNHPRIDNEDRQCRIESARTLIYSNGKKLNSKFVEQLLEPQSLVPTKNAFSLCLREHGFDYHRMMVVDFMHDIELGVWKNILTHLIRIIQASGAQVEGEFNTRFRAIAPFGPSTINRFSSNVSEMKRLAARDYEDMLQCCIPVFEGLLPANISKRVLDLLFVMAHWHSLGKLRIHSEKTIEIFREVTKELCTELRAFARYTSEYNHLETRKEKEARQKRESKRSSSVQGRSSDQKLRGGFSLATYKIHSILDYIVAILEYGTTDSYSTQIGEMQHRRVKGLFGRTNKQKDATSQITSMERIQSALQRIREDLDILYSPLASRPSFSTPNDTGSLASNLAGYQHYDIAVSHKDFIHLPTWLSRFSNDPSTHLFFPRLRSHLFSRLDPMGTRVLETHHGFQIQYDRLYKHAIVGVNYTSYDMRRCADCVHPSTERQFVLVKAPNTVSGHPFYYARVLGIFHANVCLDVDQPFQRVDFLWVRWLAHDTSWRSGWKTKRFDRLSYYSEDPDDTECLPPLDFISPSDVVRATHLIPVFDAGMTHGYLPASSAMAHDIAGEGDWAYWYAMRFVDRDMMIRYHGEGIGHHNSMLNREEDSLSDTENEKEFGDEDVVSDEGEGEIESTEDASQVDLEEIPDEDENILDRTDSESGEDYESEDNMEPLQFEY